MEELKRIRFTNTTLPSSHFDVVKIEDILGRAMDHDPTKLHIVNFHVLMVFTAGEGYHTIDFTDYSYSQGTVLTIRKDQVHKFFPSTNTKGYLIVFTEDFILSFLQNNDAVKSFRLFNEALASPKVQVDEAGFPDIMHLTSYMEKEYLAAKDESSAGILRSFLHILLTKLYRHKSREQAPDLSKHYVQEFIEFQNLVEKNCFQTKKVGDYALQLGVSTKKLNKIVQTAVHKPAKTFIDETLILQIKRLLINSKLSVKEIAYTSGFDEPTNFFKYFKRSTGSTPEAFRQDYV